MTRTTLFSTPRFDVCMTTVEYDSGAVQYYYVMKPDAVLVVPYCEEGILLLTVSRPLLDRPSLELPGGRVEEGEAPIAAAKRELAEECGLECQNWRHVVTSFPLPSVTTERVHIFSASASLPKMRVASATPLVSDGVIRMGIHSFEEVRDLALRGEMRCAVDAYAALVVLSAIRADNDREGSSNGR